jgi:hypothetical protein
MSRVLVVGDSHVVALAEGAACGITYPEGIESVEFAKLFPSPATLEPFFEERAGRIRLLDTEGAETLRGLTGSGDFSAEDRGIVFCLSLGFTTTVLMSLPTWCSHRPWAMAASGPSQLISSAVARAIALEHNRHAVEFYRAMARLGLTCIAISSPPPLIGGDWFRDTADEEVLVEVDRLAREVVQDELFALGVPVVGPPPESYVGNAGAGLRDPAFKGAGNKGFVHANAAYGRLMLKRVLTAAAAAGARQTSL